MRECRRKPTSLGGENHLPAAKFIDKLGGGDDTTPIWQFDCNLSSETKSFVSNCIFIFIES